MNTSFLTWPEAAALAASGNLVRREAWTVWLRRRVGLWEMVDSSFQLLRVVQSGDFINFDAFASDWTSDAIGATREVCARIPLVRPFIPPGIGLVGEVEEGILTLHADLGAGSPDGVYWLEYLVNGVLVGTLEASSAGRFTVTASSPGGDIDAQLHVRSALPLPTWEGIARCQRVIVATDYWPGFSDIGTLFSRYTVYDWDSCILGGYSGIDESGLGWIVDGHISWESIGGGQCQIVEATGSYATYPGLTLGTVMPIPNAVQMYGTVVSNEKRLSGLFNYWCNNADGSRIFGILSNQVR